jgi:hypothetical protein
VLGLSCQCSESAKFRKTIKTRGHFPTEEAARKLIYIPDHLRSGEAGDEPTTGAPQCIPSRCTSKTDCPQPHPCAVAEVGRGDVYGWQS